VLTILLSLLLGITGSLPLSANVPLLRMCELSSGYMIKSSWLVLWKWVIKKTEDGLLQRCLANGNSGTTMYSETYFPDDLDKDVWWFASSWLFTSGSPGWTWSSLCSLL